MKSLTIRIAITATFLVAALSGAASAQSNSQPQSQPKWWGGVKAGFNSSQFRGDPVSPWVVKPALNRYLSGNVGDKLAGFVGGGFFRRNFNHWFGLQLELLYSQKGGDGKVTGEMRLEFPSNVTYDAVIDGTLTVRLDYLEMPLLALFEFPRSNNVGFTVLVGPSFGYNTRAEADIKGAATVALPNNSSRVQNIDQQIPIDGGINRWEISGVVGAALEFVTSSQIILLDGRYEFGVTSIAQDQDTYNHTFSLTIGFMAPMKK